MPNIRYNRVIAPVVPDVITPEQKIPYFPSKIVIGDFSFNTTPTGALETKPVSAPAEQEPADAVQPASIRLRENDITLEASASFGGSVLLSSLATALLDVPNIISIDGVEMSLRSAFGRLFSSVASVSASVADISGVRLASEEAKSALNDITDAMQDVSGALLQLRVATAQSDLSGVLVRVSALESAPAFDATALEGVIADLSGNLNYYKTTNDSAVASAQSDATSALGLANTAQGTADNALSVANLAQSTADTKVAQSDYNAFVIATNSSLDSKALASDLVSGLASKADASAVALKEDIGRIHKIDMVTTDVSGVNPAYWLDSLSSVIGTIVAEGKVAELVFAEGNALSHFLPVALTATVGTAYRFKNSGNQDWILNLGSGDAPGPAIAVTTGETMTVVKTADGWKIL